MFIEEKNSKFISSFTCKDNRLEIKLENGEILSCALSLVDRFSIDDGFLTVIYADGRSVNLGYIKGENGKDGKDGLDGKDGIDGKRGPAGPEGPQGPQGPIGAEGPQGAKGPKGPEGPTGPTGPEGPQGLVGPKGGQGPIGPEGPQGPGVQTGLTVELLGNWQLKFPTGNYIARVAGGNLIGGPSDDPIAYSAGVQALLIQSANSTVVATGGSALTTQEHDLLVKAAKNATLAAQLSA